MGDRVTGMAERFMNSWQSDEFRCRCVAQIESERSQINPREDSDDLMEQFLAKNDSKQLEEFVFVRSKTREDYMSLISDMMIMMRKHSGKSLVDMSVLQKAEPEALAASGISESDMEKIFKANGEKDREDQ